MLDIEVYKSVRKAIKQGQLEDVAALIEEDPSRLQMTTPFGAWLHMAAAHGQLDIAKWLVSHGADINAEGGSIEGAPLHTAATNGHLDIVAYLLASGAKIDTSQPVRNPLIGAILGGLSPAHTAVAKLLIDSGIDTTVRYTTEDQSVVDALTYAEDWGRTEIAELLKAHHSK